MRRSTLGVVVALIALLAIVAVVMANNRKDTTVQTPSNNTTNTTEPTDSTDETTQTNTPAGQETDEVEIEDSAFVPAIIQVKKGTTVTWTNKDTLEHTVTPDEAGTFTGSGMLAKGDTFSATFNTVGTFGYHCTPHPNMQGTVVVVE